MGDTFTAREYLNELEQLAQDTTDNYRFHDGGNLLSILAGILRGEMAWSTGDMVSAVAAYIEVGEYAKAITVYEEDLREHPHNGWSLFGIKQALAAQGKTDPTIDASLAQAWARSDVWLLSSKF